MPIKRHAERRAADVRKDLHALVVGREKADDVAVARAAVQIVVAVEDHVFGAFDAAEPDHRHVAQLVVDRPGCAAIRRGRGGRQHVVIGRADIDLVDDAVAVLEPAYVDHRGQEQDRGQRHAVDAAVQAHRRDPVGDQQDDERADQRLGDRALAAAEADAAEHRGRQHQHLKANADVASDRSEACGEKERADRRQNAAADVTHRHGAADGDSAVVSGAARAADRGDVPARSHARHEEVAEDGDRRIDESNRRHAQHVAAAHPVPEVGVGKAGGDARRIPLNQHVVGGAVDDEGDQRGDEGPQPKVADEHAIDPAQHRAA